VTQGSGLSYSAAGVDRDAANRAKHRILELLGSTATEGVVANPGGFGGLFRVPAGYASPLLVASADGVGTKLKVASRANLHTGVGHDIVNHCGNDILVEGARPLFFLDYIGMGRLETGVVAQVVEGVAAACRATGCALLGGETAEMPDVYAPGEYDLAGFIVGVVDEAARPGAHRVRAGDALIALKSDGFHTNGYSLLRRLLFDSLGLETGEEYPGTGATIAEVLLRPHRPYVTAVLPLIEDGTVNALAHITGGGIPENLDRVIPEGLCAEIDTSTWQPAPEFVFVAEQGGIGEAEMFRTFNMGVGMVLVVPATQLESALERLRSAGETAWPIGAVQPGEERVSIPRKG
jgi:phosphoribosylformylglycinamidine cyclo-ligase